MGGARAAQPPAPAAGGAQVPADTQPHFAAPDLRYHACWLEALREAHAGGRHGRLDETRLEGPAEFGRFVAALRADVSRPGAVARYLAALAGTPVETWPDGFVPQTWLWWVAGDEFLGRLSIRHRLTPHLLVEGGNIGFEVRPSARRQGHATAMLAVALPLAVGMGIGRVRLDCDAANLASRLVIEKNGGVLDEERDGTLYFWVPTS
ncbi:MAG TPA: GNAT family N-acetyltransferase [Thermoleophilia bacterium]|nr:GNAT family N-acetyltransferase [Thermoleophilia bacterium]